VYILAHSLFIGRAYGVNYSSAAKYSLKNRLWVHKLRIKSGIVYKLNTSPGYVSVVTLPVIPLDVALGNTGAFSEQIVGRQIFVKPVTYDKAETSNMEIFTKYGLINILLRIKAAKSVTYNLNLSGTLKNVFAVNYIKNKIDKLKTALSKKYSLKMNALKKEGGRIESEKKQVMELILLINRTKINKSVSSDGITLTLIAVSRIRNIYYLQYQLTNNGDRSFLVRNVYLYKEYGGNFFDGYNPDKLKEIPLINRTPHDVKYMPYKIIRNVLIFKKTGHINKGEEYGSGNLKVSFHIISGKRLIKLKIGGI
jgi:hypothetical protein